MADPGDIGRTLADQGRVVRLTTRGRVSGRPTSTAVGFVEDPDGTLLVAAGDDRSDWARNIAADPIVTAARSGREQRYRAERLEGAESADAVSRLILRYGTPAEGLGRGPAFRLRPVPDDEPPAGATTDTTASHEPGR